MMDGFCFAQGMSQFDKKHADLEKAEIYAHQFHRLAKSSSLGEKNLRNMSWKKNNNSEGKTSVGRNKNSEIL
jgi:hypothetical protein